MKIFKRDIFGNILIFKKWLIRILGLLSFKRFSELKIKGAEKTSFLPKKNVLFISNHQTYFADATAIIHVLNSSLNGNMNSLKKKSYIWNPKLDIFFVAAKETMKSGFIPKILSFADSVQVERTWREKGKSIERNINTNDIENINKALLNGWLITFPQGTTNSNAPVRKGTAYLIKNCKPTVIPIVIEGFNEAFSKSGLRILGKKLIKLTVKLPLKINYESDSIEQIIAKISNSIKK